MEPKTDNKLILQFSVRADIFQLGLQFHKMFSSRISLLDCGGFCCKIFRLSDVSQPKGGIEVFDLPLQFIMGLPQRGDILSQRGGIFFLAPVTFLPNAGHFHRSHSLDMKSIQNASSISASGTRSDGQAKASLMRLVRQ